MNTRNRGTRSTLTLALASALLTPALTAAPDPDHTEWIPILGVAPPGTPATIVYDASASSATESFFDITIPGFWVHDVEGPDGVTYQRIEVPGLGSPAEAGVPELPVVRLDIAVPAEGGADASADVITFVGLENASTTFPMTPYPVPFDSLDGSADPNGPQTSTPEQFVRDDLIYEGTAVYPGSLSTGAAPLVTRFGSIPAATHEVSPFQWDPTTGLLTVASDLRVGYYAPVAPAPQPPITKDRAALASITFENWPGMGPWFDTNEDGFHARYLVVIHDVYLPTMQTFIDKKEQQGFQVEVLSLNDFPGQLQCFQLRGAIDDWYQQGDPSFDHYALLVDDTDNLPLCTAPVVGTPRTDDLYGSPADGDLFEEIYVGRLSIDHAGDLAHQIDKMIGYMEDQTGDHYEDALVTAHWEGFPNGYIGNMEKVVADAASFDVTPNFFKFWGNAKKNVDLLNHLNSGKGLVAYRGHGGTTTWAEWNIWAQHLGPDQLDELTTQDPSVVWSFSCWNSWIDDANYPDSLAEDWMSHAKSPAVAHYGSTEVSSGSQNNRLNPALFEAVFDKGITRHGQAIAWAEDKMYELKPGTNSWMYMLLGDPSMRLRRKNPDPIVVVTPGGVDVCSTGCDVPVQVLAEDGSPLAGMLVSAWQAGGFQANAYTDADGYASLPAPTELLGELVITVGDMDGNEVVVDLPVTDGAWTDLGGASTGIAGMPHLQGTGSLSGGSLTTLDVTDAAPAAPALMFLSFSSMPVPFKGVLLQAFPIAAQFNLGTDAAGEIPLAFAWPNGLPAGAEVYFQTAIADAVQPLGVSITNAVKATTP